MLPCTCIVYDHHGSKGRCVQSQASIKAGTTVFFDPVITFLGQTYKELKPVTDSGHSTINAYAMRWTDMYDSIPLGLTALMNHSRRPNCMIVNHLESGYKEVIALRNIKPNEELTIKYGCKLWFKEQK